ncbi:MAG: type VI secretion system baseplate subunit TssF [Acetobacteraceae bacterium]|nr:type VI secretion system baseplate subunit TssF [Acetobacteraceae bacterium]
MSDALLPYYNRELIAVRELAGEFARLHPKIAGRLRLSADATDDPHVERLLEGVAFLAARVHHRLDDEFPELTDALLDVLYPHYLAPVPSCAVVQFTPQPDVRVPVQVPRQTPIDTEPVAGQSCRFRTAYATTLWPVEIESLRLSGLPLVAPAHPRASGASAVLRIGLRCTSPDMTFRELGVDRLRFYLRGESAVSLPLYELLCGHVIGVAFADGAADPAPVALPAETLEPAGFAPEEALFPWPARSFSGFRLLTEYFAFPEKFLFLDVTRLEAKTLVSGGRRLDVFLYLDRAAPELERVLGADSVALGCTPVVNLFPHTCEPVPLTHTATEYRLVPDVRRPAGLEVWRVERVREARADGTVRPWSPFYRLASDGVPGADDAGFYGVVRRQGGTSVGGTETFLAPHDPGLDPDRPADAVLSVEALCLNRDLPAQLPFGGGQPRLKLTEGLGSVSGLACLTPPTPTLRPPLREGRYWRLISHLSLGHLSVVGNEAGAQTLKEVLRLYDLRRTAESQAAIDSLVSVSTSPGTARVPGSRAGSFCRGLDVTLEYDAATWNTGGLFLLAAVMERFLALHATINAFVRTRVTLRGRPGLAAAWPARAGARTLL